MCNINDFGINYLCQGLPFGGVKVRNPPFNSEVSHPRSRALTGLLASKDSEDAVFCVRSRPTVGHLCGPPSQDPCNILLRFEDQKLVTFYTSNNGLIVQAQGFSFCVALVELMYGNGLFQKAAGLYHMIRAGMAK